MRWVLSRHGLQQQQLAEVMGVKTDRVKSLVLGRATKLRAEELGRLEAAYGLPRAWLVDGSEPAPLGWVVSAAAAGWPAPVPDGSPQLADRAPRPYLPPTSATDALLLQQVVDATAAALAARGLHLPAERRLRLYWAVFELSLAVGQVNRTAIPPLIKLAEGAG